MISSAVKTKRIALATLFGVMIFATKIILPTPMDKMLIVFQALLLALASLLLRRMGATYTAIVGGLLTTVWRVGFFPFSLVFAIAFGLMIDGAFYVFGVRMQNDAVRTGRLITILMFVSGATGLISTYVTVIIGLMPWIPILYVSVLVLGMINGAVAGYVTSFIWKKYLIHHLQ